MRSLFGSALIEADLRSCAGLNFPCAATGSMSIRHLHGKEKIYDLEIDQRHWTLRESHRRGTYGHREEYGLHWEVNSDALNIEQHKRTPPCKLPTRFADSLAATRSLGMQRHRSVARPTAQSNHKGLRERALCLYTKSNGTQLRSIKSTSAPKVDAQGQPVADWIPADKYTLVKALQSGAEASTTLTASATTGRIFVVKKFTAYYDEWTEDGKVQAHGPLPNEAAVLLEKITPHESILNVLGADFVCIYKGMHCNLYTEFADAGDLSAQISHTHKQRGIAPEVFILHLFVSLADALAYVHAGIIWDAGDKRHRKISEHKGYLHGDVKPGNTFLQWTKDQPLPRIVLGDFGMSQPESTARGIFGTRVFFAPEMQAAYERSREPAEARKEMRKTLGVTTQKSDVYALAQTIVDAMTYDLQEIGADPYTEPVTHDDKKGWQGIFLPKSFEVVALKGALQRCLVADPAKRCNLQEYSADGLQGTIGVLRAERDRRLEEAENIPRDFWKNPREVVEVDNEFLVVPEADEPFEAVDDADGDMLR
ncbi:hypothetical protein LTR95_004090 [Oleoguttula sp. CCFEE 5521]